MTAAVAPVPAPFHEEGRRFWEGLISECKEQISAINAALMKQGRSAADKVECRDFDQLHLIKSPYPSTIIKLGIAFERWGPVIRVSITGHQRPDFGFFPQEIEVPLATDEGDCIVAVFDEGRSLCPRELASYLTQHFRRCFPDLSLPCPNPMLA